MTMRGKIVFQLLLTLCWLSVAGCPSPTAKKAQILGFFELASATTDPTPCPACSRLEIVDTVGASKAYFANRAVLLRIGATDIDRLDLVRNDAAWHQKKLWSGAVTLTSSARERLLHFASTNPGDFVLTAGSDLAIAFFDRESLLTSQGVLIFSISQGDVLSEFEHRLGGQLEWISDSTVDREEMCKTAAKGDKTVLASCLQMTNRESADQDEARFRDFEREVDRGISEQTSRSGP